MKKDENNFKNPSIYELVCFKNTTDEVEKIFNLPSGYIKAHLNHKDDTNKYFRSMVNSALLHHFKVPVAKIQILMKHKTSSETQRSICRPHQWACYPSVQTHLKNLSKELKRYSLNSTDYSKSTIADSL